ncbi:MAG TPA: TIGR01212 family radical SAM protein [Lentisphaeria bacterium]|nr:MAG: TIGR01212 family radical SAM protein [Lentisphaerae bacterium GWF2_38_69]HBM15943.1 TIGR01212 family radical SAM protein [Lentisphaeria bacterium]
MKRRINFFKDYLTERFGHALYRIPIDLGLGCPHKNINNHGCIYCAEDGARAIHLQRVLDIREQVREGIKYVNNRYSDSQGNYIAYLQTYTNTYGNIDKLKSLYETVLSSANFTMLMLSTRPDCLNEEILEYISELNKSIETWVEIGVQTSNNRTLSMINRQHDFQSVINASAKLNLAGVKSSAHIMIGLPGETMSDYIQTVNDVCSLGFTGIKLHNTLILKNSYLGKLFNTSSVITPDSVEIKGIFSIPKFNEYEYIDLLIKLLRIIPEDKVIMRLTADAEEKNILFPKWHIPKPKILETLFSIMEERNLAQGDSVGQKIESDDSFLKIKTSDSSFTFYNPLFKENYHSTSGGLSEALYKFVSPSNLPKRLAIKRELTLLDVGFGLGYNALTALNEINKLGGTVRITSLELDESSLKLAQSLFQTSSCEYKILESLRKQNRYSDTRSSIELILGDARTASLPSTIKFDLIYLDAFSTQKNSELWTYDFIRGLSSLLYADGAIITYSASFAVRGAFIRCGMFVGTTEPFGRKNGGTIASFNKEIIESPLSEKDMNIILKSTAGTPYRDTSLKSSNNEILVRHEKLIRKLRLKGIPKWYK